MVASTSFLTLLATLAATSTYVTATPSEAIHELLSRQNTIDPNLFPPQCRDQCSSLANSVTNGSCLDLDCICSSSTANNMIACLNCGVAQQISPDTAQSYYDSYANACKSGGKSVPSYKASGSGSGSGSGTGAGSGSASPTGSNSGSSGSSGSSNGASRVHLAGVGLAGAVGAGLFLAV